jgi:antitoxin component of MazEF toxin-antitoxin module
MQYVNDAERKPLGVFLPMSEWEKMRAQLVLAPVDSVEQNADHEVCPVPQAVLRGKCYALADILDSFTPAMEHPAVDFGKPQGEEIW